MPRVLTLTQKPEESPEQFAARIAGQLTSFFGEAVGEPEQTSPEAAEEAPTDVSAGPETGEEEPAPSS